MKNVIVIVLLNFGLHVFAQNHIQVIDQETYLPIIGAKITCKLAGEAAYFPTNDSGHAVLPKNIDMETEIVISHIIYDTLFLKSTKIANRKDTLKLYLSPIHMFDDVVVTAQYKPIVAHNAIQKINVITLAQIEQSGAVNLADILNYQTGIRLTQDNILGSSLSLGGLSGQNIKILVDGIAIIGRQDGNLELSQINLDNIERIEIIEGPLSVNYGTNALAGTINLITKKSSKKALEASIHPYFESIGNYNLTGRAALRVKNHQFTVTGGRNFFDGWSKKDDFISFPKAEPADTNRFKTWKPKEQYFFDFSYITKVKGWEISPFFRYFDEEILNRGRPLEPYKEKGLDDYYYTLRQDYGLSMQKIFPKSSFNSTIAYNRFNRIKNTYIKDLTNLSKILSDAPGAQDTSEFNLVNIRANYVYTFSPKLIMETGLDLIHEDAYGRRIEGFKKYQGDYALYTTLEWVIKDVFTIKPGLRYAYNTTYQSPITPSINFLSKWKKFRFRASVGRGFRAPSLKELYFEFMDINHNISGNDQLLAEKSMNYSANVSLEQKKLSRYKINYDYTFFYNDIKNLITLGAAEDGNYTYFNLGTFKSIGNQFRINAIAPKITSSFAASYIGRYNRVIESQQNLNLFVYSPEFSLTLSYKLMKDKFRINAFYKYNGALQSYFINELNQVSVNSQAAYSILDLSISTDLFKKKFALIVGVKNVFDITEVQVIGASEGGTHQGSSSLNAARGRSVFVSLKYNWSYDFRKN